MATSRRHAIRSLLLAPIAATAQDPPSLPLPKDPDQDTRLPNGKSQRDEIARHQHEEALKDVETLLADAQELRDELKHAGNYVLPVTSLRKTEEIEKLAKRIHSRLKN